MKKIRPWKSLVNLGEHIGHETCVSRSKKGDVVLVCLTCSVAMARQKAKTLRLLRSQSFKTPPCKEVAKAILKKWPKYNPDGTPHDQNYDIRGFGHPLKWTTHGLSVITVDFAFSVDHKQYPAKINHEMEASFTHISGVDMSKHIYPTGKEGMFLGKREVFGANGNALVNHSQTNSYEEHMLVTQELPPGSLVLLEIKSGKGLVEKSAVLGVAFPFDPLPEKLDLNMIKNLRARGLAKPEMLPPHPLGSFPPGWLTSFVTLKDGNYSPHTYRVKNFIPLATTADKRSSVRELTEAEQLMIPAPILQGESIYSPIVSTLILFSKRHGGLR